MFANPSIDIDYVILGAGQHAAVLVDAVRAAGTRMPVGILDANRATWNSEVLGVPVLGGDDQLDQLVADGVAGFTIGVGSTGDAKVRRELFQMALSRRLKPVTIRHPSAVCSAAASLGAGTQLLAGAIVGTGAGVGRNVIINTAAVIDHDCVVGDHAHIAPGAQLAGNVSVGSDCHIGIGAILIQGVCIGSGSLVGAGTVVLKNVSSNQVVVGNPARLLRTVAA